MMVSTSSAAAALFDALKAKDLSAAPLAENVIYQSPLSGEPIRGRANVARFLAAYLPVLKEVRIERQITDDSHTALVWHAESTFGPLTLVYICRVEQGEITEVQAYYDPRGFLEQMGNHS
jgi:hypothetical protein